MWPVILQHSSLTIRAAYLNHSTISTAYMALSFRGGVYLLIPQSASIDMSNLSCAYNLNSRNYPDVL